ncbi:MAG TPA: mechanosensitive ion channel domain-containing protein [Rhizomicrobium sp.]|nr:mechanosensitive ion channel domain-containing protein [Rhizomicrobium sp.]
MALFALNPTIPAVAAMPGEVKEAIPALTVMMVNGAINFLIAVLILIAGWVAARWIGRWVHDLIDRSHYIDDTLKPLIANFAAYGVLAITVVAVLSQFGVQTTSLIALLGAAGLAIGLALQGTLSNVASGVMLLILRPFRIYDKIKVADVAGTVREIGLFRTEIVTDDGNFVSIPNATLFSGTIINASRESMRRTHFTVEVDRNERIDAVQKAILEKLEREPRVLKAPAPVVEVDILGPISTTLTVHAWVRNSGYLATLSDIKKLAREAMQGADIAAPVPVAPPAVAPWTPSAEQPTRDGKRPN